jgi:hypothetical protein
MSPPLHVLVMRMVIVTVNGDDHQGETRGLGKDRSCEGLFCVTRHEARPPMDNNNTPQFDATRIRLVEMVLD